MAAESLPKRPTDGTSDMRTTERHAEEACRFRSLEGSFETSIERYRYKLYNDVYMTYDYK